MTRPLKIGLLAEGETELGGSIPYVTPQEGGKPIASEKEGALHTLIRRELSSVGINDCEFIQRHPSFKESGKGQVTRGYSVAQEKYVKQVVSAWSNVDLIIILIDSDDDIEKRRQEISTALAAVKSSHFLNDEDLIEGQHAGGLAIRDFETWLLADPNSLQTLCGVNPDYPIEDLENLPTDSDQPLYPKNIFDSILEASDFESELTPNKRGMIARWKLAKIIDLAAIKSRCPQGYAAFVNDFITAAKIAQSAIDAN